MPITPPGNSSSSDASAPDSPKIWAIPSPTSTMVPTPATSAPSSKPLISLLMIDVISSDRIAMNSSFLTGRLPRH